MDKKIVILDGYTVNPGDIGWDQLEELAEIEVYDRTPSNKIIKRIGDTKYIFTNKTPITRETIEKCKNLEYIGLFSTGYNIVDIVAAKEHGIVVSNVPNYSTSAVAQFTFALILNLCHKVQLHSDLVHKGKWVESIDFCFWKYPQIELMDKTLGIIGFGNIGKQVARIAFALNMKVLVYTRTPEKEIEDINLSFVDKETLFKKSDIISLHCPLFEETKNIINKDAIALMKESAIVINTARGGLVNERDMCEALHKKKIAGFAADVISQEPMEKDNPLQNVPNCIISPHIAWVSSETRKRLLKIVANNFRQFLAGTPCNIVN